MKTINVDNYTMSFYVDTDHGSDIEFVLSDAEKRNNKDEDYYLTCLIDILNHWLSRFSGTSVQETSQYGSIHIMVSAKVFSDLSAIKTACSYAVNDWRNRYRINQMKRNS